MRAAEHGTDLFGLTVPELAKSVAVPSEQRHDLAILGVVAGLVPVGELPDRLRREVAHRVWGARVRVWSGFARRVTFSGQSAPRGGGPKSRTGAPFLT